MAVHHIRIYWPPSGPGSFCKFNADFPGITHQSVVHISVCEYTTGSLANVFNRFIGDIGVSVRNVQARDGGVSFVLNIDSASPVLVATDITYSDGPLEFAFVDKSGALEETPLSGAG
jgi:hypothetical protein